MVSYGLWTVYENTLTPAALDQVSSMNPRPSLRGELSPTAARALKAYGGEAVWKDASAVQSTVTVGGLLFQLKGINIPTPSSNRSTNSVTSVFSTGSA